MSFAQRLSPSLAAIAATTASALLLLAAGCPESRPASGCPELPADGLHEGLRTRASFSDEEAFFAWSDVGAVPVQAKFVLTQLDEPGVCGADWLMDPRFYDLHDEWYWFRLLNGYDVPGFDVLPANAAWTYDSVHAVYEDLLSAPTLPFNIRRHPTGRIWSQGFYDAALNWGTWVDQPRFFGIGSLLYFPPNPARPLPEALWLFELEYADQLDEALLQTFFDRLEPALPPAVAGQLRFLSRGSPYQDQLVAQLRAGEGPLAARAVLPSQLAVDGEVIAYNTGITAGRVARFEAGALGGASVGPDDIAVLAAVPDYLPPVAGIITAVPQTPLAHLNLLAKARGTPNAHVGGVMDDRRISSWATIGQRMILKVSEGAVRWKELSSAQWKLYQELLGRGGLTIPPVDLEATPLFVDLDTGGLPEMAGLVPSIGGKCAGMLAFLGYPELETPYRPYAITVRAYAEHLASYRALLDQMLAAEDFKADTRLRFLVLEGREDFLAEHAGDAAALGWLALWDAGAGADGQLGEVVAAGGFKALLRAKPLSPLFADALTAALEARYGALARTQGLRLRSSSTAEDVPGFNGAGLYDSNTGYLHADELLDETLRHRTVAWALKTWASYWSFEAFEERQLAGIDHLSGNMAVLVHPRFDDEHELANGVITFTLREDPTDPTARYHELIVNVQDGALSVTNPDPLDPTLPEIDRLLATGLQAPSIERVQPSSVVPAGTLLMPDADLVWLFDQLGTLASDWLANSNAGWSKGRRSTTLVLDLEFKRMAAAWPATVDPVPRQDRLVLKQVRVLDNAIHAGEVIAGERCGDGSECPQQGICAVPIGTTCEPGEPIPRDLLSVAAQIQERSCASAELTLAVLEVSTDPSKAALLGHSEVPFVARVSFEFTQALPGLSVDLTGRAPDHTQLASVSVPAGPADALVIELVPFMAELAGWRQVTIEPDGAWTVTDNAGGRYDGVGMACAVEELLIGPGEYLERLLDPP